jgi:hypothetical protein
VSANRSRLGASALFAALLAGLLLFGPRTAILPLQAQNLGQRNISGSVVDDRSAPVAGATVFLKNQKTKAIRSYTSAADGRFRFAQVSMSDDYDLWAEKDGHKTAVKTVSSWDARKEFETELKMK